MNLKAHSLLLITPKVGNVRYREAILKAVEPFALAEDAIQRNIVVLAVINTVTSVGGRFLHKINGSELVSCLSSLQPRRRFIAHYF